MGNDAFRDSKELAQLEFEDGIKGIHPTETILKQDFGFSPFTFRMTPGG